MLVNIGTGHFRSSILLRDWLDRMEAAQIGNCGRLDGWRRMGLRFLRPRVGGGQVGLEEGIIIKIGGYRTS